jgi:hypothetical protein
MIMFDKLIAVLLTILGGIVFIVGLSLLFAFPFMWAWNYAVVNAISVCQPISYWMAFVLMLFVGFFIRSSK